jgi:AcrR family transcriptional regulator
VPPATTPRRTSDRILDAALAQFGRRGYEATSLDALAAELSLTKQAILYWFPSKEALLDAVVVRSADDLRVALEHALAGTPPGFGRVETVMSTVFRFAVRRPALLGLVRELSRLPGEQAERLRAHVEPLVERAVDFLAAEMHAGRLRRGEPRLVAALAYATVTGIATEPEALRGVGWEPTPAGLRRLRTELRAFLRAALAP